MPVEVTTPPTLKRVYPHVDAITDWRAAHSIRLLWDRIFDLEARLQAASATVGDLVAATNTQHDQLTRVDHKADEALALAQGPGGLGTGSGDGDGGGDELPGGGDGGEGAAGCGDADATTAHGTPSSLSAREAGKIVCGVGFEFPALLAPVADADARAAQAEEFTLRAIWHLAQGGFTVGRQQNPSGALSKDKLAVIVDGTTRAYDVLQMNLFSVAMTTQMVEVGSPHLVADPGTPD